MKELIKTLPRMIDFARILKFVSNILYKMQDNNYWKKAGTLGDNICSTADFCCYLFVIFIVKFEQMSIVNFWHPLQTNWQIPVEQ